MSLWLSHSFEYNVDKSPSHCLHAPYFGYLAVIVRRLDAYAKLYTSRRAKDEDTSCATRGPVSAPSWCSFADVFQGEQTDNGAAPPQVEMRIIEEIRHFVAQTNFELFTNDCTISYTISTLMLYYSDDFFQLGKALGVHISIELCADILSVRLDDPAISCTSEAINVIFGVVALDEDFVLSEEVIKVILAGPVSHTLHALLDPQMKRHLSCDVRHLLLEHAAQASLSFNYSEISDWLLPIYRALRNDMDDKLHDNVKLIIVRSALVHGTEYETIHDYLVANDVSCTLCLMSIAHRSTRSI